jgi:hypothetical protein
MCLLLNISLIFSGLYFIDRFSVSILIVLLNLIGIVARSSISQPSYSNVDSFVDIGILRSLQHPEHIRQSNLLIAPEMRIKLTHPEHDRPVRLFKLGICFRSMH